MRVGGERFWNARELIGDEALPQTAPTAAQVDELAAVAATELEDAGDAVAGHGNGRDGGGDHLALAAAHAQRGRAAIVGHIPVTWRTADGLPQDGELDERLQQCIELILRAQIRHGSSEVWLSPFLKGAMSQHFSGLVHPERRALINELRNRGVIRIEERENQYADHPYSVIVLDPNHPMVQAAVERAKRREEAK